MKFGWVRQDSDLGVRQEGEVLTTTPLMFVFLFFLLYVGVYVCFVLLCVHVVRCVTVIDPNSITCD